MRFDVEAATWTAVLLGLLVSWWVAEYLWKRFVVSVVKIKDGAKRK